jgi:hypothetical protein
MRIIRPLVRKATKTIVYPLAPIVPVTKSVAFGTRRGNLNRKEVRRQTGLLKQQNALLEQHAALLEQQQQQTPGGSGPMVTPDGKWVSYDGGETYQATAQTTAQPSTFPELPSALANSSTAAIACIACKERFDVPASQTAYTCPACGAQYHLRLCPGCSTVVHVAHSIATSGRRVKCLKCRTAKPWAQWDRRPVTAVQYAALVGRMTPQPAAAVVPLSVADEIGKLAKLHDDGALSDAEFASAKARLLT